METPTSQPQAATYAIGDLHGEVTLLQRLLTSLPLGADDTLVFLGDYVDRGEDSLATIDALQALAAQQRCIFLRGNHDAAWLEVWDGARFTERPHILGARQVWERCGGHLPAGAGHWLASTRLDYEDGHAYYVHAGTTPGRPFWETPVDVKLWGDRGFLASGHDWGKLIVCGHYEVEAPVVRQSVICVDTAAYRSGVLTAVRVQDRQLFQVRRVDLAVHAVSSGAQEQAG